MLYTFDAYYKNIHEDADLSEGNIDAVTENFNKEQEMDGSDLRIISWKKGAFGDCWVKFYIQPKMIFGRVIIDGFACRVGNPGSHPGGRAWWCTPVRDVYVPVYGQV